MSTEYLPMPTDATPAERAVILTENFAITQRAEGKPETLSLPRATIFTSGILGYIKTEVNHLEVSHRPYAQYASVPHATFTPKRKRTSRAAAFTSGRLVVLEGWGHPDLPDAFNPSEPSHTPGVTVRSGRHSGCSPAWDTDLTTYLKEHGLTPAADYRKST